MKTANVELGYTWLLKQLLQKIVNALYAKYMSVVTSYNVMVSLHSTEQMEGWYIIYIPSLILFVGGAGP